MSGQVVGSVAVATIVAVGFGFYYFTTESSLSSLSSQLSSNQSSLSAVESAISTDQASISSMEARISSLSSEVLAAECSASIQGNATSCSVSKDQLDRIAGRKPQLLNVTGSLHVPGGTGQGTLDVIVYNGLNESIISISVNFGVLSAP